MPYSLTEIIKDSVEILRKADIDTPALDARLLIASALGLKRLQLLTDGNQILDKSKIEKVSHFIQRRVNREPVARILGQREFWGLPFFLNEATLEPRPDSETLVEVALKRTKNIVDTILDLGTGTGCLVLALLHEIPSATGVGIDRSPRAIEQATENAAQLGLSNRVRFIESDWLDNVPDSTFDIILSNPPYITSDDVSKLMPEVRDFDPHAALDGGLDGLAPYRHIIPRLSIYLAPNGFVLFEIGQGQETDVVNLLKQSGFIDIQTHNDLAGICRCVSAQSNT